MIDWISASIPLRHDPLPAGRVMKITAEGEIEWETSCWTDTPGSHDSSIRLRSRGPEMLCFSGNPSKWLQGHNVFGSNDLAGLLFASLSKLQGKLRPASPFNDSELTLAVESATLSRVDLTESFALRSRAEVLAWLRAAASAAYLRHRGRGELTKEGTLYFGKKSQRWSLKMYSKGQEVLAPGHQLPVSLPMREELQAFVDNLLRVEETLRGKHLDALGLRRVSAWLDNEAVSRAYVAHIEGLEMSDQLPLKPEFFESLPPRLKVAYSLWQHGEDLREQFSRRTFYRYRRQLLEHGIDIAVTQPKEAPRHVAQLRQVLCAQPVGIPDWAYEAGLVFVPPSRAA